MFGTDRGFVVQRYESISFLTARDQCQYQQCRQYVRHEHGDDLEGIVSMSGMSGNSGTRGWRFVPQRAASSSTGKTRESDGSRVTDVANKEEEFDRIAKDDPLFRKPVGAVEGTGWGMVIAAGLAIACIGMYSIAKEFVSTPKEQIVYEYVH